MRHRKERLSGITPELTQLKLEYVAMRLKREPDKDLDHGVTAWTDFRTVVLAGCSQGGTRDRANEKWRTILHMLHQPYEQIGRRSPVAFAKEGTRLIYPLLRKTFRLIPVQSDWIGCFRYDFVESRKHIAVHFRNSVARESPFADMDARFRELSEIVADIREQRFCPETIGCASWVCNLAAFQRFFPSSFTKLCTPSSLESEIAFGWWGQFITKEGRMNQKRAELLRKTGTFEFTRMSCVCAYREFTGHVARHRP